MSRLGPDQRAGYINVGVVEGYDIWAPTYDHSPNPLVALEEKVTLGLAGNVAGKYILDLGCGTGRYAALLAKSGAIVTGVEPSTQMLEQARQKLTPSCNFELYHGTMDRIHFSDEQFDIILSALTLGHVPELESTLAESARVLKGDGVMLISDIHPYWPVSGHDYTEFFGDTGQEYRIPEYPHLLEDYWNLFHIFGMRLEELREPRIEKGLVESFPSLRGFEGIPLAMILKARKVPKPPLHRDATHKKEEPR